MKCRSCRCGDSGRRKERTGPGGAEEIVNPRLSSRCGGGLPQVSGWENVDSGSIHAKIVARFFVESDKR